MLGQFHPYIHDSIENIVDVKADDNCGYRAIAALLTIGEDSWSLVSNHLLKELAKWSDEYINLLSGIDRFEELKRFLHYVYTFAKKNLNVFMHPSCAAFVAIAHIHYDP